LLDPQQAIYEKPEESKHQQLKALYVSGFINGNLMGKMMVDGGAAVNVMSMTKFRKLGKRSEDLIKTNVILKDFKGDTSEAQGVQNVELTIDNKRSLQLSSSSVRRCCTTYCLEGIGFTPTVAFLH
jgi:hypothetical protein